MPNVETNNKNNAPSAPSSQKSKKDKRKSLAVTTEKDGASLRQETLSPITPALESVDSGLENVNKNPYIDVVIKRIRKLKKMMIKIEKYETIKNSTDPEGAQLNADQIKVLERKGEVSGAIKEFEETLKQIEAVEKDELKKQDEQKKAQQAERDQAIADAVEAYKAVHCKSLLQLILFFRLVHFNQRGIIQLSDTEFEAVETLRAKLTTLSEQAENNELYDEKAYQVLDHVNKLHSGDESPITKSLPNGIHETDEEPSGISYSQLRSMVQNPPILESSGEQEETPLHELQELSETFESVPTSEITIQPEHIDDPSNVAIQASGLQFMLHSDDQPQSQIFDNSVNVEVYSFQSTDAEQIPAVTGETMVDHNVQEQYNQQQQNYDKYAAEQQQQFTEQYIGEQQHFVEQNNQQEVEQELSSQQQEEPLSAQEPQTTLEDQVDSKPPQAIQQSDNQPPPLSQGSGHRGGYRGNRGNRSNRGYRGGHGSRRDSGGYNRDGNYGYYREGGYRGGRGGSGPRGGRGGFQGSRGAPRPQ